MASRRERAGRLERALSGAWRRVVLRDMLRTWSRVRLESAKMEAGQVRRFRDRVEDRRRRAAWAAWVEEVEVGTRDRATWAMAVELGDVALVRASWGKWRVLGEVLEREAQADVWRRGVLLRRAWSSLRWMTHLVMAGGGGRGETNEKLGEAS